MNNLSVVLINPKFSHNVGAALRAVAAFGGSTLYWTGDRVTLDSSKGERLPREERMRGYKADIHFEPNDAGLSKLIADGLTPVCVEVKENAENLVAFEHPERAVYIFGPEDGSLDAPVNKGVLHVCHRFVHIPTRYCLNLGAAINVVLYDRKMKRMMQGKEPFLPLKEELAPTHSSLL